MDEPQTHDAQGKKPVTTEHALYDSICLKMPIMGILISGSVGLGVGMGTGNGHEVSLCGDGNVLKLACGDGCTTLNGTCKRGEFRAMRVHFDKAVNEQKALGGYRVQVTTGSGWRRQGGLLGRTDKETRGSSPALHGTTQHTDWDCSFTCTSHNGLCATRRLRPIRFCSHAHLCTCTWPETQSSPWPAPATVHEETATEPFPPQQLEQEGSRIQDNLSSSILESHPTSLKC